MFAFSALVSLLAGASMVLASPLSLRAADCSVSAAKPSLPSGQTNVTIPSGQTPQTIALGVGIQNYTCTAAGTYTSAGAVADLFDASCIYDTSAFSSLTQDAYDTWTGLSTTDIDSVRSRFTLQYGVAIYAQHYFGPSPSGTGISPVFDARATSQQGNPNAYVLASKSGDLLAPTGTQDVDWLALSAVQGSLAKTVMRLDTKFGQPPSSCTPGSALISVKYAALYWLYA